MKKFVSLALALVLAFPASLALAVEPEVSAADIRAQEIQALCEERGVASAMVVDENGVETPIDVTYTVSVVSPAPGIGTFSAMSADEDAPVTYMIAATAASKHKDGSATGNTSDYDISVTMRMYWTDVPGSKNTIDSLVGSYTLRKGTPTSAFVQWGTNRQGTHDRISFSPSVASFNETINYASTSPLGDLFSEYQIGFGIKWISVLIVLNILD